MSDRTMLCAAVSRSPLDGRPCTACQEPIAPGTHAIYVGPLDARPGDLQLLLHPACAVRLRGWLEEALGDLPEYEAAVAGREALC